MLSDEVTDQSSKRATREGGDRGRRRRWHRSGGDRNLHELQQKDGETNLVFSEKMESFEQCGSPLTLT